MPVFMQTESRCDCRPDLFIYFLTLVDCEYFVFVFCKCFSCGTRGFVYVWGGGEGGIPRARRLVYSLQNEQRGDWCTTMSLWVAKRSTKQKTSGKWSSFEELNPHNDLDPEDSNPVFLHGCLAHDEAPPGPWRQQPSLFAWQSCSWWCTTVPSLFQVSQLLYCTVPSSAGSHRGRLTLQSFWRHFPDETRTQRRDRRTKWFQPTTFLPYRGRGVTKRAIKTVYIRRFGIVGLLLWAFPRTKQRHSRHWIRNSTRAGTSYSDNSESSLTAAETIHLPTDKRENPKNRHTTKTWRTKKERNHHRQQHTHTHTHTHTHARTHAHTPTQETSHHVALSVSILEVCFYALAFGYRERRNEGCVSWEAITIDGSLVKAWRRSEQLLPLLSGISSNFIYVHIPFIHKQTWYMTCDNRDELRFALVWP